ncbi:hypothetical protein GJ496_002922 [Pomphorhynchus laevis]|nr:hypothetical protein GJ496_002922 [Pomphorhynchus laevis]
MLRSKLLWCGQHGRGHKCPGSRRLPSGIVSDEDDEPSEVWIPRTHLRPQLLGEHVEIIPRIPRGARHAVAFSSSTSQSFKTIGWSLFASKSTLRLPHMHGEEICGQSVTTILNDASASNHQITRNALF